MKPVVRWPSLIVAAATAVFAVYKVIHMHSLFDLFMALTGLYLTVKEVLFAFNGQDYEKNKMKTAQLECAYHRVFGKWSLLMRCIPMMLVILVALLVCLPQIQTWTVMLMLLLLMMAAVFSIWLNVKMSRELEKQQLLEEQHLENASEHKATGKLAKWLPILLLIVALLIAGWGIGWNDLKNYPQPDCQSGIEPEELSNLELALDEPHYVLGSGHIIRWSLGKYEDSVYTLMPQKSGSLFWLEQRIGEEWMRLEQEEREADKRWEPIVLDAGTGSMDGAFVQSLEGYKTNLRPGCYRLAMCVEDKQGKTHTIAHVFVID